MWHKVSRLFVIKKRWEAYAVIYALAVGATGRGLQYIDTYPGVMGSLLFLTCTAAVFMAGAKILDATQTKWNGKERRSQVCPDRRAHWIDSPEEVGRPALFAKAGAQTAATAIAVEPHEAMHQPETADRLA